MSQNTPIERMKKILALARRGVDGEKDTAEAMLAKLLAKYNMTVDDLDGSVHPKQRYTFRFKTEQERRLLVQIVASVLESRTFSVWTYGRTKKRGFELTALQHAEVDVRYTACRAALNAELAKSSERILQAFIQANGLGVKRDPNADQPEPTEADLQELAAIMALMRLMKPTPIHRQLERAA